MRESRKMQIKEWADGKGLTVKDYHEAEKHYKDYKSYSIGFWFYVILALSIAVLAILLMNKYEDVFTRCTEMFSAFPYQEVVDNCSEFMGWK